MENSSWDFLWKNTKKLLETFARVVYSYLFATMNAIKALVTTHQNPYGLMFAMGKVAVWNPDRTQFHTQQTPLELRAHVVVDANKESTRVPVA